MLRCVVFLTELGFRILFLLFLHSSSCPNSAGLKFGADCAVRIRDLCGEPDFHMVEHVRIVLIVSLCMWRCVFLLTELGFVISGRGIGLRFRGGGIRMGGGLYWVSSSSSSKCQRWKFATIWYFVYNVRSLTYDLVHCWCVLKLSVHLLAV